MTSTLTTPAATAELAATVAGPVLEPGDPGFAEQIAGFNTAYTPMPAVVVGATGSADVAAALRYAARTGRRVAATGHGLLSDLDGTVMVTTRRMTGVRIDPRTRPRGPGRVCGGGR